MRKYMLLIILVVTCVSSLAFAVTPTYIYPVVDDVTVAPGYQDIVVRFNDYNSVISNTLDITPYVPHIVHADGCEELGYNNASYTLYPCYRLRMVLQEPLEINTSYTVSTIDLSTLMTVASYSFFTGFTKARVETGSVTFTNHAPRKPKIGTCDQFYVTLWNDPDTGINFQKWYYDDTPMGGVTNVDSNVYYSDYIRVSMDMNSKCDLIVGYMNDYPTTHSQNVMIKYKFYQNWKWDGVTENWGWRATVLLSNEVIPQQVIDNSSYDAMLFDNGGPAVALNERGGYVVAYQTPMCRWDPNAGPKQPHHYFCDNYIKAWYYDPPYEYGGFLGEYRSVDNNQWHFHAGQTINIPPGVPSCDMGGYPEQCSQGCGGKGPAYDCPYHVEADLTNDFAIIKWTEHGGNAAHKSYEGTSDDPVMRIFNLNNDAATREIFVSDSNNYWKYDDWGGKCVGLDGTYDVICTWMDRTANYPTTSDIKARKYWVTTGDPTVCYPAPFGGLCYLNGGVSGGSKVINQITTGDQINPNLVFSPSDDKVVFAWESSNSFNQTGPGGYGVYTRFTDRDLNFLTGDIRMNNNNTIKSDWEEAGQYSTLCDLWSDHVGLSCNSYKDCYVAWNNPDYQCTSCAPIYQGYASHGRGYSVKSAVLTDCADQNYVTTLYANSSGIQEAYESAVPGDIMTVGYGTYNENLHFDHYTDFTMKLGEKYECGQSVFLNGNLVISQGAVTISEGLLVIQ